MLWKKFPGLSGGIPRSAPSVTPARNHAIITSKRALQRGIDASDATSVGKCAH